MPELAEWDSFYVIVGSAAGALIGLQFVVLTLIAENPPRGVRSASAAFLTPTIVHFSVVLLLSAILRAPWHGMRYLAPVLGAVALGGVIYSLMVFARMRAQKAYQPELVDWAYYVFVPGAAYVALAIGAFCFPAHLRHTLFAIGGASLALLMIGIRNAWDTVSYNVLVFRAKQRGGETATPAPDEDTV